MIRAITRAVSASIGRCELTHLERVGIDLGRARRQHAGYCARLRELGARVQELPAEDALPDAVFVEDTAIVLDEVAILTRPGAVTRRAEVDSVARVLAPHRPLLAVEAPARIDGGDVLRLGRTLYVGRSGRTDDTARRQLADRVSPYGYAVVSVEVRGCLHLKSAVSRLNDAVVLANPDLFDADRLRGVEQVRVAPEEPAAANALPLGERVLLPDAYPRTADRLRAHGFEVVPLALSELIKAEGAVTCCSLVFDDGRPRDAAQRPPSRPAT